MSAQLVVVLGAPGTGKTSTVRELARILLKRGVDAAMTASNDADEIDVLRAAHGIVLLDAGLGDTLTAHPLRATMRATMRADEPPWLGLFRKASVRMLMSLDLAWLGNQSGGKSAVAVREQADSEIRAALQDAGLPYAVVAGHGGARIEHALSLIDHLLAGRASAGRSEAAGAKSRWRWFCDDCGDGDCEQHWLPRHGASPDVSSGGRA